MQKSLSHPGSLPKLRVGQLVEVLSKEEILATLDENGKFESLPFMAEMFQFCGKRYRVDKLAIKLCDTIDWSGLYRMDNAVHLAAVRCDGEAHGGCQAGCLIYWKEAWLKQVADHDSGAEEAPSGRLQLPLISIREGDLAKREDVILQQGKEPYVCQATELVSASAGLIPAWDLRQYVRDVRSGNVGAYPAVRAVAIGAFNKYQELSRRLLPSSMRIRQGMRFPFFGQGALKSTPTDSLDLQPGELVRIKPVDEIVKTLDETNRNRGLSFDPEMLKYCGRQARVLRRVKQIIDEKSGKMVHFGNPCIVLDDVTCTSDFHRLCPRAIYPYWREIWLERVEAK